MTWRPHWCRSVIPKCLRFVTSDFLSESLAAGKVQDPERCGVGTPRACHVRTTSLHA